MNILKTIILSTALVSTAVLADATINTEHLKTKLNRRLNRPPIVQKKRLIRLKTDLKKNSCRLKTGSKTAVKRPRQIR